MKVKVGNKIFDGNKEPVMVILSDEDKQNIANMAPKANKYLCYPENGMTEEEAKEFMKVEEGY